MAFLSAWGGALSEAPWGSGIGWACVLLGVLLVLLAAHPFVTYPLSLSLLARMRPIPIQPAASLTSGTIPSGLRSKPKVALCVCAYNEESVIGAKVENMLALRDGVLDLEILVYVDAAIDRTAEILRPYQDRMRVVVAPSRAGKTAGMNILVSMTDADLLVFSDANVRFAADAVPRLLAPFADPAVGAACGHLVYVSSDVGGAATAETGSLYWRLEERIKALESATGSVMGADGSIFAMRRALHRPPPPDLIDDMYVSLSVLCGGARIVRAADALAYEEGVSRPGEEFARKIRIACQAFNVHRALWPQLRALPALNLYKYISHKLLRWLTVYLLAAGVLCILSGLALAAMTALAAVLLTAGLALLAAMGLARRGPLATLRHVAEAFLATGIGVQRSLAGKRFQTWNPPASARGFAPFAPCLVTQSSPGPHTPRKD